MKTLSLIVILIMLGCLVLYIFETSNTFENSELFVLDDNLTWDLGIEAADTIPVVSQLLNKRMIIVKESEVANGK